MDQMNPTEKGLLLAKLDNVVFDLKAGKPGKPVEGVYGPEDTLPATEPVKTLDKLPMLDGVNAHVIPKVDVLWPMFPVAKMKTAPLVKLRDATQMYQPVGGSSKGSRYFMVAANDDIRVAARFENQTLSIRVEGPNWQKHKQPVLAAGLGQDSPAQDYASVHLNVGGDLLLANKTLGAVLLGLGLELQTPMPNVKVIA
jgi:hypothetical protein